MQSDTTLLIIELINQLRLNRLFEPWKSINCNEFLCKSLFILLNFYTFESLFSPTCHLLVVGLGNQPLALQCNDLLLTPSGGAEEGAGPSEEEPAAPV